MTSQKAIEALIAEIDGVLASGGSRLPMFAPGDVAGQRRVLQRVRSYLVSLQQQLEVEQPKVVESPPQEAFHAIAKAVVKEMTELRAGLLPPLQADLESLRQQRESLVKEIRVLETQRQHYQTLAQQQATQQQIISEFLQALTNRLQESLTHQITQTLANLELKYTSQEESSLAIGEARRVLALESGEDDEKAHQITSPLEEHLHPRDRLEHLRQIERESDQLLMRLDSTIRVVFESLQNNVLGYEESLSQGVAKMHSLGQQGELLFTALVNHLAEKLGREASTIVHSSQNIDAIATVSTALASTPETTKISADQENLPLPTASPTEEVSTQGQFAFPGMELQVNDTTAIAQSQKQKTTPPLTPDTWEIVELDLDALGLEPIAEDEIDAILQLDVNSLTPASAFDNSAPESSKAANELIFTGDIPSVDANSPSFLAPSFTSPNSLSQSDEDDFDSWLIDSSLDLSSDGDDSELDDLYESLFGSGAVSGNSNIRESEPDTDRASQTTRTDSLTSSDQISENSKLNPDGASDNSESSESSQFEEAFFGGVEDLATHSAPARSLPEDTNTNHLVDSWEEGLFFEDAPEDVELEDVNQKVKTVIPDEEEKVILETAKKVIPPQIINNPSYQVNKSQEEGIETISLLTDLFQEKQPSKEIQNNDDIQHKNRVRTKPVGKETDEKFQLDSPPKLPISVQSNHNASPQETHSNQPASTNSSSVQVVEDSYIQARLDEDLLASHELKSDREIEFLLNENILEQLSEDLSSFEASATDDFLTQESSKTGEEINLLEAPSIAFESEEVTTNNKKYPYKEDAIIKNSQLENKGGDIASASAPNAPIEFDWEQELSTSDVPAMWPEAIAGDSQTKDVALTDSLFESAIASNSDLSSAELDWDSDLDLLEAMNLELDTNADTQDDDFTNWTMDANIAPTYSEWELLFPHSEEFTDFDQTDDKKQ